MLKKSTWIQGVSFVLWSFDCVPFLPEKAEYLLLTVVGFHPACFNCLLLLVFTLPVLIVCSCDITKLRLNCFLDSDFWLKFLMDCLCNILLVRSSPYSTESYTILHKTLMWSCHSVSFITLLNDEYVWQSVNDPSIIWVGISA